MQITFKAISVEDDLPEYEEIVLVAGRKPNGKRSWFIGFLSKTDKGGHHWQDKGGATISGVTHYAKMPEVPPPGLQGKKRG